MDTIQTLTDFLQTPRDSREYKRALVVQMAEKGLSYTEIMHVLQVSRPFISKWRKIFRDKGVDGFLVGYRGGTSYLTDDERHQVLAWIAAQERCNPLLLRTYLRDTFDVTYQSPQSYYALLKAAGLRYKKVQASNPQKTRKPWQPNTPKFARMAQPIGMRLSGKNG